MEIWTIPANPKYYDTKGAFDKFGKIYWRQAKTSAIEVGDYVYIYIGGSYGGMACKCSVLESHIPYSEELIYDKDFYIGNSLQDASAYMLLERVNETDDEYFKLKNLRAHGLKGNIQGPRRLKGELLEYLEKGLTK